MTTTGLGEFWDKFVEETEEIECKTKERTANIVQEAIGRCIEEAYMDNRKYDEMTRRYNFILSPAHRIALERLEGIKVDKYRNKDYADQNSFYRVWWSVLHEVGMYEEGEESPLNKTTLKGAKNWLKSFSHLCEGDVPEEYKPKEA